MDIIQRDNKYFLQLANGELELSAQQVRKRMERGDRLHDYLQSLEGNEPKIPVKDNLPKTAQTFLASGKYFDNIIREFEQIYALSENKQEAAAKLIRFCQNSINKLQIDRKNPRTDHVVIDYYTLSWSRVIAFIQSLAGMPETEMPAYLSHVSQNEMSVSEPEPTFTSPANPQPEYQQKPTPTPSMQTQKSLISKMLIIQLMQADGLFPISDAMQGVTQEDIIRLIGSITDATSDDIQDANQTATAILLKRGSSNENLQQRIQLLEEIDAHFEKLPYPNIISRVKLLLKNYRDKNS